MSVFGKVKAGFQVCLVVILLICVTPTLSIAATYYVAPGGSDSNPGTEAQPFLTIQKGVNIVNPGDTVYVKNGTYNENVVFTRSGNASNWITIKAYPGHSPAVMGTADGALWVQACYIEINGFTAETSGWYGAAVRVGTPNDGSCITHHVRVFNNTLRNSGESGLSSTYNDYVQVKGNRVYGNCRGSEYQGSGISLFYGLKYDSGGGFHNIVENNFCYDNVNGTDAPWCPGHTDGEGIIIDNSGTNNISLSPNYLIQNNLCFDNGGRSISLTSSYYCTVINNSTYKNSKDPGQYYTHVEFEIANGSDHIIRNNIFYGIGGYDIVTYYNTSNITTENNCYYNGNNVNTGTNPVLADPRYVSPSTNPATINLHLQNGSPCINAGTSAGAPSLDYDGNTRPQGGAYDIGAYEYLSGGVTPTISATASPTATPTPTATSSVAATIIPTVTPTLSPTSSSGIVYAENFDDGLAQNWTIVSGSVTGGKLALTNWTGVCSGIYEGATFSADYTYQLEWWENAGDNGNRNFIYFNYVDANNYYFTDIGGGVTNTVYLKKKVGGTITTLATYGAYYPLPDQYTTFEIIYETGGYITVKGTQSSVTTTLFNRVQDLSLTSGKIGGGGDCNNITIDNVVISKPGGGTPAPTATPTVSTVVTPTITVTPTATPTPTVTPTVTVIATVTPTSSGGQAPFGGNPWTVDSQIEAENYDLGGQNVAYYDLTTTNEGGAYRSDYVDIKTTADTGGGYAVGWFLATEWLEYTVNVPQAGTYNMQIRVGSMEAGRTFHIEFNGVDKTGAINVPQKADWDQYDTVTVNGLSLGAGQQIMRVVMGSLDYMDLNWLKILTVATPTPTVTPTVTPTPSNTEILSNPGFESGITSWTAPCAITSISSPRHSGSKAIKLSSRVNWWDGPNQDVTAQLLARGQGNYTLQAWIRLSSGTANAEPVLKIVDSAGTHLIENWTTGVGTTYTLCQVSGSVTWTGTLSSATFYVQTYNYTSDFYVDDCSLKKN